MSEAYPRDNPVIREVGFKVLGTKYGGWIVLAVDDVSRITPTYPLAAFSTFEELLAWLGKQTRHDNMPSPAEPGPDA